MAELRAIQSDPATERAQAVTPDGGGTRHPGDEPPPRHDDGPTGAEELAVALAESDRGETLAAHYEVDADGAPLIRIVDRARDETVALITPEELKALAQDTGLPPGLLVRVSS